MTKYEAAIDRRQRIHGEKFSTGSLDPRFVQYYNTGERIRVATCGEVLTGTVGMTTGWAPAFLLMRTRRSIGSMWTLGPKDRILAVQRGRTYHALEHIGEYNPEGTDGE